MFTPLIWKAMEVYVNDMFTESLKMGNHVEDLTKMFDILKTYKMKLNLVKCTFRVSFGKFLGIMVNH